MTQNNVVSKFIYRSSPIFRENDKEAIEAWESRTFNTMLIFCKLYRNEEDKQGIGYVIMYEDGWQYGSFEAHLSNLDIKEASLKGLFEILLYAKELNPRRVIIWSENKSFLEQLRDENIRRKKKLSELLTSFEQVKITDLSGIEIENIDDLRESALSSAKLGSKMRCKHKIRVILKVCERKETEQQTKWRMEELGSILAKAVWRQATRPIDVKIADAEKDLRELENNKEEEPDFEVKRNKLIGEIDKLKQEMATHPEKNKNLLEREEKAEDKNKRAKTDEEVEQILKEKGFCPQCLKKLEKEWKFCPFCSTNLDAKKQYVKN